MLPTPEAKLASSGPDYARMGREGSGGDDLTTAVWKLLPTPIRRDADRGAGYPDQPGRPLSEAVHQLLPTPTGDSTGQRSTDGNRCLDDQPQLLL